MHLPCHHRTTSAQRGLGGLVAVLLVGSSLALSAPAATAAAGAGARAASTPATTDLVATYCPSTGASSAAWEAALPGITDHLVTDALAAGALTLTGTATSHSEATDNGVVPPITTSSDYADTTTVAYRRATHLLRVADTSHRAGSSESPQDVTTLSLIDRVGQQFYSHSSATDTSLIAPPAALKAMGLTQAWVGHADKLTTDRGLFSAVFWQGAGAVLFGPLLPQVHGESDEQPVTPTACRVDDAGRLVLEAPDASFTVTFDDQGRVTDVLAVGTQTTDEGLDGRIHSTWTISSHATVTYSVSALTLPAKRWRDTAWRKALARKVMPKLVTASLASAKKAVKGVKGTTKRTRALQAAVEKTRYAYGQRYGWGFTTGLVHLKHGVRVRVHKTTTTNTAWTFRVELKGSKVVITHRHLP